MASEKLRILVNLPPTFFTQRELVPHFARLEALGEVRQTSHDTAEQIAPDLAWAEAVLMWSWPALDAKLLGGAAALRYVGQINSTRVTAAACHERGIAISEARHCWAPAVAEMALALMLSGLRRLGEYHHTMRVGSEKWVENFPADIDPTERQLTGRTVGIVGFGGIGRRLAEFLAPFRTTLLAYDPFVPESVLAEHHAKPAPLEDLLKASDVVVLCAANTPEAARLLGERELALLRPHAVLVNVGRSMLLDMPALARRLAQGDLIAMLDVFDREPLETDSPLRSLPNTYLTPHRAGGLVESIERAFSMLIGDLEAHLSGAPRRYELTPQAMASLAE